MAYDLGIKINLIDSDIVKIENTIKKRMNEISDKYKIKLSIENKSINDIEKQLEKVKTALEKTTINLDGNLNIDSIVQFFSEIDIGVSELETKKVNLIDSTQVELMSEVREGLLENSNNMASLKGGIEQVNILMNSTKTTVKDIEKAIKNASESVDGNIVGNLKKNASSMGEDITSKGFGILQDGMASKVNAKAVTGILTSLGIAATETSLSVIALSSALTIGLGVAISVAINGIKKIINKKKELQLEIDEIKKIYSDFNDALENNDNADARSKFEVLAEKEKELKSMIKRRNDLQYQYDKYKGNIENIPRIEGQNQLGAWMEISSGLKRANQEIEDFIHLQTEAGETVDETTGKFQELADMRTRLQANEMADHIIDVASSSTIQSSEMIDVIYTINTLTEQENLNEQQKIKLKNACEFVKSQYDELNYTIDENGRAQIYNMDILNQKIPLIEAEGRVILNNIDAYRAWIESTTTMRVGVLDMSISQMREMGKELNDEYIEHLSKGGVGSPSSLMMQISEELAKWDDKFKGITIPKFPKPPIVNPNDNEFNKGSSYYRDSVQIEKKFQTNFPELDKYKIKIDRVNEQLEKQEKIIDKLNKQRKKYSENNDSNNELKTIQQLTKEYDKLIKILKSEQKVLANTKESIKKDFFNLTKIDISKYSKAQLEVIYAERYGGLREYKDEKSKKAAEDDEKKFKLLSNAWLKANSTYDKIEDELYEIESKRLKNIEEYWESILKIRDKNLEKSKNDLEDARANLEVIESIYNDRTGYDKKIEAIEEIINATQVYKVKLIEENAYLQAQLLTLKEGSKEWEDFNNRIRENDKEIRNSSKSLAEYSDKKKEIEVSKLNAVKDIEEKIINLLKEKYKVVQEKEEDRHRTALENIEEERKAFNEYIDEKIKALDKEEKKENYNKELNKKLEEKAKLQKQLDALMLDSSLESKAKQEELLEQLKNKQEEIEEFQNKYALDLKKENLQEQKEAHNKALDDKKKKEDESFENYKKALERQLEYDKLYDEARRILVNGFYTDAVGNVVDLSEALLEYEDKFGEGLSAVGTKIKTEIIENLLEVQDLLANGFNGTILSGNNYIGPIDSDNKSIIGYGENNFNNKDKKQSITIFGNSIDLANAQILASKHGVNAEFENVANTSKMPNANDIVLGQAANNYSNSTGAIKLTGKNRDETKSMLEAHFIKNVKGSYADGGIANFAGLAMMHGTEDRPELVLNNSQASSLFNFVKNIDSGVTIRHNAINPMRSIPYGEQITNNSTIKIDKLIEINGDVDEKVLPQIEQGTLNSLNMLKRELNKSGVFSRR